jgi:hypothetical protein
MVSYISMQIGKLIWVYLNQFNILSS